MNISTIIYTRNKIQYKNISWMDTIDLTHPQFGHQQQIYFGPLNNEQNLKCCRWAICLINHGRSTIYLSVENYLLSVNHG
jgi:hypothetical protein